MPKENKEKKESEVLKTPKEASNIFHNIMKASVSGNPKPKVKGKNKG
jgi:hypothetical protein